MDASVETDIYTVDCILCLYILDVVVIVLAIVAPGAIIQKTAKQWPLRWALFPCGFGWLSVTVSLYMGMLYMRICISVYMIVGVEFPCVILFHFWYEYCSCLAHVLAFVAVLVHPPSDSDYG